MAERKYLEDTYQDWDGSQIATIARMDYRIAGNRGDSLLKRQALQVFVFGLIKKDVEAEARCTNPVVRRFKTS